jgi:hypothetical protein
MKYYTFPVFLFLIWQTCVFAQETPQMVRYDKNFAFRDGIYLSFEEFRNNRPSISAFKVVRNSQFSAEITLEYQCVEEKTGNIKTCIAEKCWGYALNNNVYIAQGISGYYFRLHIIGALIHFYSVEIMPVYYYDYTYGYPDYRATRRAESREYVVEFATGRKISFNYRDFSRFLLENDRQLYDELQKTKKKKKMIYHFLLKYNEKYPIAFPE